MSGIEIKVGKLFGSKKNVVISALDHVMEYGYQPGIEDARGAIENCIDTDALLLPRAMLERHSDMFKDRNAPLPVVRINWSSAFYYPLDYRSGFTTVATTVEEAVRAGAEAVICSLFLENMNEAMETDNVRVFSEVVREKEKLGIPLIGECYVVEHKEMSPDELHNKVKRVTRIMVELGADLIKCFYTKDFDKIVSNLPVPAFTIGAEKLSNDLDVLKKASDSVASGARGIIFGRNIFMADKPKELIAALNRVINNGENPESAYERLK
ncbi:MAG: class I fructose-bisphosphate aldolase [Spirochaetia bacterium]